MNTKRRLAIEYLGICSLSMSLAISGCGPSSPSQQTPTSGVTPSAISTTMPSGAPTPALENLADASDLRVWIEDYVHAYGGTVNVNGVASDAEELLGAVRASPGRFVERKTIKGQVRSFFTINGVPLGIQTDGTWRSVLARDISDARDAQFAMPVLWYQIYNANFVNAIRNANLLTITRDLDTGVVFEKSTTEDWRSILLNWGTIKTQLDSGQIPNDSSYNWKPADQIVQFARENHMGIRAQHLVWNGDVPDSIYKGGFTKAELLKILEFMVKVKVLKYKGVISEWNAADELVLSEGSSDQWGFWQRSVGLLDATRLAASSVRTADPTATITIADDHEMESRFYDQQPKLGVRFMGFVKTLRQEGLIDKVDIENNLWIYDLPELDYMGSFLRQIQAEGIGLSAAEITVYPTRAFPLWYKVRQTYATVDDLPKAQAEGYRRAVQAYVNVGAYDIGMGDVGDETSSANYLYPDTNPALFDIQWKPKMAFYEVLEAMYDGLIA